MSKVFAIALNTFREAVRDKVLIGVLGFAIAVLLFSLALAQLSLDQNERVVLDVGLASISLFSVLTAIFLGSSLLYKEIERKTLYVILPRPLTRWQFLLGKYIGISITGAVFVSTMGSVQLWVTGIQHGMEPFSAWGVPIVNGGLLALALLLSRDRTALVVPWSLVAVAVSAAASNQAGVALEPILAALVLTVGETMLLAAVALLFSSFSTPFLTGILTFGIWLVGRSADTMITMKSQLLGPEILEALRVVAEIAPNFNLFVPGRHALSDYASAHGGAWGYVASSVGYGALYSTVLFVAASAMFRRRDLL